MPRARLRDSLPVVGTYYCGHDDLSISSFAINV